MTVRIVPGRDDYWELESKGVVLTPGEAWAIRWHSGEPDVEGPFAGYAIVCVKCSRVHYWTTAVNCSSRRSLPSGGTTCDHGGKASCWTWTGSIEGGDLTATPSLQDLGDCKWHGHATAGELV